VYFKMFLKNLNMVPKEKSETLKRVTFIFGDFHVVIRF
jgi:hypothetical protein